MDYSIYRVDRRIQASDVDMFLRLRLSRLFTLLEQSAMEHTELLGFGKAETLDRGLSWVILAQEADVTRMPVLDEAVTLTTEPGRMVHMLYSRFGAVTDPGGAVLLTVRSTWALMDSEKRTFASPGDTDVIISGANPGEVLMTQPPRVKEGTVTKFTVPFSYTDINRHMNNARYLDLADDLMPEEFHSRDVKKISVVYSSEAPYGFTMDIKTQAEKDCFLMSGFPEEEKKSLFRLRIDY